MFRKISESISEYFIVDKNLLITSEIDKLGRREIIKYDFTNKYNTLKIPFDDSCGIMSLYKNSLLIQDYEGNVSIYDYTTGTKLKSFHKENFKISLPIYQQLLYNSNLVCSQGKLFERKYGFYNILEDSLTWNKDINDLGFWIFDYFIINNPKNCVSIQTIEKNILWHFTLESLHQAYEGFSEKWDRPMEIANFCGVAHEVLWMDVVCRGIGNFLLGLDVHTGQPVHLLDKAENRFERYPFDMIPTDGRTTYDAKRNILFGFAPDWVHWQVDLSEKSPQIKMWDLTEEVTPRNAYVSAYMNCGISDSHIFFPVGSLGSTPQVFALNRETLKIDWQYHFTEGGAYFTPTKVEVTDTHLYVLDNTGTLHIFEKTEDN